MGVCGRCSKQIQDTARICFDCMFDLAEEERKLRLKSRSGFTPGTPYLRAWPGQHRICNNCWPYDCQCIW